MASGYFWCKRAWLETSLVVQWLTLNAPNARDLGLIPAQGIRSHILQLRSSNARTKDPASPNKDPAQKTNKNFLNKEPLIKKKRESAWLLSSKCRKQIFPIKSVVVIHSFMSDSEIPWNVAQAPWATRFSRQEYWSGLPFPPPGDLPDSGIKPSSPASSALEGRFIEPRGKPIKSFTKIYIYFFYTSIICQLHLHFLRWSIYFILFYFFIYFY